jgi:hypothetical protein
LINPVALKASCGTEYTIKEVLSMPRVVKRYGDEKGS